MGARQGAEGSRRDCALPLPPNPLAPTKTTRRPPAGVPCDEARRGGVPEWCGHLRSAQSTTRESRRGVCGLGEWPARSVGKRETPVRRAGRAPFDVWIEMKLHVRDHRIGHDAGGHMNMSYDEMMRHGREDRHPGNDRPLIFSTAVLQWMAPSVAARRSRLTPRRSPVHRLRLPRQATPSPPAAIHSLPSRQQHLSPPRWTFGLALPRSPPVVPSHPRHRPTSPAGNRPPCVASRWSTE